MPGWINDAVYKNEQRVDQQIRTLSRLTSRTPIQSMTPKIVEETPIISPSLSRSTRRRSPSPRMSPSRRISPSSRRSRRRSPHL